MYWSLFSIELQWMDPGASWYFCFLYKAVKLHSSFIVIALKRANGISLPLFPFPQKVIQVLSEQNERQNWQNFHFWIHLSLNAGKHYMTSSLNIILHSMQYFSTLTIQNLQNGSDFRQLASTSPDWKSRLVYSSLKVNRFSSNPFKLFIFCFSPILISLLGWTCGSARWRFSHTWFFFKQMHEVAEGFKPKQQHSKEQTVELFFHMMPSAAYA